jgi:hypothetical protein
VDNETSFVLLGTDFERDPVESGWALRAPPGGSAAGAWAKGAAASGGRFISVRHGHWESPAVAVRPFGYYRLSFQARTSADGYWFAVFEDAEGKELQADCCDSVFAAPGWEPQQFFLRAHALAARVKLRFQALSGELAVDDVRLQAAEPAAAAAWADALAASNPPVRYVPPTERWERLPRTLKKLQTGAELRVVLLGDSIANDTANSLFELLLRRARPPARLQVISSVRGGTGCPYYRQENRIAEYVLRHRPDLLVIAGISHGYDPEAIRDVIRQVRAAQEPEVLVLTDAVAPEERMKAAFLKGTRLPLAEAEAQVARFPERIEQMVGEERVAWLNLRAAWNACLSESPRPEGWFLRDEIHANCRGKQVLARILERHFAPDAAGAPGPEARKGGDQP